MPVLPDLDLTAGIVSIRERKRVHGSRTTHRVPLSSALTAIRSGLELNLPIPGGVSSSFRQCQATVILTPLDLNRTHLPLAIVNCQSHGPLP